MDDINLTIKDKIVTATASVPIVCGNTYHFVVNFDDEWENVTNKVGRIRFGAEYYDIPFQGTDFSATMPFDVPLIEVGVYSDSVITTSGAKLRMVQAILSGNGTYVEFSDELYEQYKTEMSDMLVDQSLDPTSNHAVSNKVVADNYIKKTGDAVPQVVTGTGGIQVQGDLSVGGDLTVSETGSVHFDGSDMEVGGMAIEKDSTATVLSNEAGGIRFKGSVTVPTTATGVKTQDAVNGQRLQADLDAYAPMVRTSGNQTISGVKTFKSSPTVDIENKGFNFIYTKTASTPQDAPPSIERHGIWVTSGSGFRARLFIGIDENNRVELRLDGYFDDGTETGVYKSKTIAVLE